MVEAMHDFVLTSIKAIMQAINYLFVSANEVITLDNWKMDQCPCLCYERCRFSILLTLECVEMNAIANNITLILLKCMAKYGGVSIEELD